MNVATKAFWLVSDVQKALIGMAFHDFNLQNIFTT